MTIGQNIKKLRQFHNLSQKDFALIAGVTDKAVSTWEQGVKEPRMGVLQKIADHFNLKKSNIIEDNGLEGFLKIHDSSILDQIKKNSSNSLTITTNISNKNTEHTPGRDLVDIYLENQVRKESKITVITEPPSPTFPILTPKDERQIAKDLETMLDNLDNKNGMAAYNDPDDEEDLELLKASLEYSMRLAKQMAKKNLLQKISQGVIMDTKQIVVELMIKHKTNNPFIIADNLGIVIIHRNMKSTLGFYNKYKRFKFIHLNHNTPEKLQTFVCAHELGHAIQHPNENTPFLKRHTLFSTTKIEREANTFAVELLMPDSSFGENDSIYDIARCAGIPNKLVELKQIK